jgi:tetratricopeptide (TPR) repeat protein
VVRALQLRPGFAPAILLLAKIRSQRAVYQARYGLDPRLELIAAKEELDRIVDAPYARAARGNVRFHLAMWAARHGEDARPLFEAAEADLTPATDADSLMRRGRLRAVLKRFAEAEQDFEASLRLWAENPYCWTWRAAARLATDDRAAASRYLDRAIAADPLFAEAWQERGRLRLAEGDRARALSDLRHAIALDPSLETTLEADIRRAAALSR